MVKSFTLATCVILSSCLIVRTWAFSYEIVNKAGNRVIKIRSCCLLNLSCASRWYQSRNMLHQYLLVHLVMYDSMQQIVLVRFVSSMRWTSSHFIDVLLFFIILFIFIHQFQLIFIFLHVLSEEIVQALFSNLKWTTYANLGLGHHLLSRGQERGLQKCRRWIGSTISFNWGLSNNYIWRRTPADTLSRLLFGIQINSRFLAHVSFAEDYSQNLKIKVNNECAYFLVIIR